MARWIHQRGNTRSRYPFSSFSRFRLLSANLDPGHSFLLRLSISGKCLETGTRKSYQFIPIFAPANGSRGSCTVSPSPPLSLSLSPPSLSVSSLLRSFQRRGRQPLGNPGLLSKRGLMSHRRDLFLQRDILSFILPSLPTEPGVRISPYP